MKAIEPVYSGKKSKLFWDKINAIKTNEHEVAYMLGVILQNIENDILHKLNLIITTQQPAEVESE